MRSNLGRGWCQVLLCGTICWLAVGCVSVKAPEKIVIGDSPGSRPVDTSRVPPTRDHAEARQRLAEAYQRIEYLESRNRKLEQDNQRLRRERDEAEERADRD